MKITKLETLRLPVFPLSCFLRVYTDCGLIGLGESTNQAGTIEGAVHDFLAPLVLGQDARDIEKLWNRLYAQANFQGCAGAELRAMSALDIALWDLFGKASGLPVYRLLGGKVRDSVPIYNTCGSHGGYRTGRMDDQWFMEDAGTLAEDLLKSGIHAMKIWPLDGLSTPMQGQHLLKSDLMRGLEPFRKIRDAVGDEMEIAVECHSCWNLPTAIRIAEALQEFNIKWLEDPIMVDNVDNLAALRQKVNVPILASERLFTRMQYLPLFAAHGTDIVMVDLSWTGGLTEGKKIAALADAYRLPITAHNCGGPVLTRACAHFNISTINAIQQETVRAIYRTFPDLISTDIGIENGRIYVDDAPGLGVEFKPEVFDRTDVVRRESAI